MTKNVKNNVKKKQPCNTMTMSIWHEKAGLPVFTVVSYRP